MKQLQQKKQAKVASIEKKTKNLEARAAKEAQEEADAEVEEEIAEEQAQEDGGEEEQGYEDEGEEENYDQVEGEEGEDATQSPYKSKFIPGNSKKMDVPEYQTNPDGGPVRIPKGYKFQYEDFKNA